MAGGIDAHEHRVGHHDSKFWTAWKLGCRIRYGYLFFVVLLFSIIYAFTFQMEVFFKVFVESEDSDTGLTFSNYGWLVLFPFILLFFGWLYDVLTRLVIDCFDGRGGGLIRLRLAEVSFFVSLMKPGYFWCGCFGGASSYAAVSDAQGYGAADGDGEPRRGGRTAAEERVLEASRMLHPSYDPVGYTGPELPPLAEAAHKWADLLQPWGFDAALACGAAYAFPANDWDFYAGLEDTVQYGIFIAMAFCVFFIFLDIIIGVNPRLNALYYTLLEDHILVTHRAEVQAARAMEGLPTSTMGYELAASLLPDPCLNLPACRGGQAPVDRAGWLCLWTDSMTSRAYSLRVELPVVVAAYLLANYLCFSYPVTGFITLMVVLILFAKNVNVLTQLVSNRFQHFVTIFAVLSSMLFALAYFAGASADSLKGTMNIGHPAEPTTKPSTPWTNHYLPYMYEVCNVNYYGLHVTDLALLSEAAYMVENTTELHAVMEEDFGDTALSDYNVTSVVVENYNAFFETHFPRLNTTVISVRGTSTGIDALMDMHYWFGIGFLQTLSYYVFPVLNQMPSGLVQWVLSIPGVGILNPDATYTTLTEYVERRKGALCASHAAGECRLLITGHSLGGGMASLAGATSAVKAVSFSGPGLYWSVDRFGITQDALEEYVTIVKPQYDLVPRVDENDGTVADINCPYAYNYLACHGISLTAVTLYENCGDPRGRDWSEAIQYVVDAYGEFDSSEDTTD